MEEKQMDTLTLWVDELETEDFEEGVLGESKVAVPIAGGSCGTSSSGPEYTHRMANPIKC
jgi:hypothetical protein